MQEQSHQLSQYIRSSFDPAALKMSLKTLTHDYYILELPLHRGNPFYVNFPFYRDELDYRGKPIVYAPVARIYGTNEFSQKCCCHVHGYYPYFYIKAGEYADAFKKDRVFVVQFLEVLEGLYQRAYATNKPIIMNGHSEQKMDFYGFHQKPETFLKITLYDPGYMTKLRELLDSEIIGGRSFQCYEAHINYFMQLFSDHNIYGINELSLIEFTFRKNLHPDVMQLFRKVKTQTKGLLTEGFDLATLEAKHPQLFNCLEKNSSCYIEIDFCINSVLNTFHPQHEIDCSQADHSIDSEMDIEMDNQDINKKKFQVKITKALEQIWQDEKQRRAIFGIKEPVEGILDLTKNIQGKNTDSQQTKDPMWINFIKKGNNMELLMEMVRSSQVGRPLEQKSTIEIQRYVAENYSEVIQSEKQKLIDKVQARWKYYGARKANYIEQIIKGEREELPEWDEDEGSDNSSSSSKDQEQEQEEEVVKNQTRSEIPKKKLNNVVLYRNNYKHVKAALKKDSFFNICGFCKNIQKNCICPHRKQERQAVVKQLQQRLTPAPSEKSQTRIHYEYRQQPPSFEQISADVVQSSQRPFYSNFKDLFAYHKINPTFVPCLKHAQILDRELLSIKDYNREPISIEDSLKLPYFFILDCPPDSQEHQQQEQGRTYRLRYQCDPPSFEEVVSQTSNNKEAPSNKRRSTSIKTAKEDSFVSDLLVFHYQFLCNFEHSVDKLYADPQKNQIISFSFQTRNFKEYRKAFNGVILVQKYVDKEALEVWTYDDIYLVKNQYDLLCMLVLILFRIDPDILVTFDQEKRGIRYLTQRGFAHGINLQSLISRSCDLDQVFSFMNFKDFTIVKSSFLSRDILLAGNIIEASKNSGKKTSHLAYLQQKLKASLKKKPVLRKNYHFDIEIKGRVNLNLSRICEQQLKLRSYTIENIYSHLFNEQICELTDKDLFSYYTSTSQKSGLQSLPVLDDIRRIRVEKGINFVLDYIHKRIDIQAEIVVNLNIISVLVEKSKIFGADLVSMMERGSQFKIEAILCRVTKKLGYLTLSASKRQVGNQSVLECMPLVLEPPKEFFSEPVLVFDFQSLYPSIMIAYNYCYSTCLGSITSLFDKNKSKKIGVCQKMNISVQYLEEVLSKFDTEEDIRRQLQGSIFISPNKVAFVKKNVRQGVIPRILLEFLISRIMIKKSEQFYSKQKIKQVLSNRQFAIKLFMNVMYGYSGASFSGRMPCSQIADSIVETSKYLLKQAIDYLNSHSQYKGKVLYGDTDSIFFHMPGYSVPESIRIGRQLALEVTGLFPYPIQMKFEKVFDGLFLVAKKRYYGKYYESETSAPKYLGKGLECVRRDGIGLTQRLMQEILNKVINTRDLSLVKQLFRQECAQVLNNQKPESDFCLAKEVKLLKYTDKTCPAHGEAAKRLEKIDPMLMPKYGERMKYFVTSGGLKPVKSRAVPVFEYMLNKRMSLDLDYYLRKQVVPPIQRVLSSLADLSEWTASTEYRHKFEYSQSHQLQVNKKCLHCHEESMFILCEKCLQFTDKQLRKIKKLKEESMQVCNQCTGNEEVAAGNRCVELNCEELWRRRGIDRAEKNIEPEIMKLKQALKQLNF